MFGENKSSLLPMFLLHHSFFQCFFFLLTFNSMHTLPIDTASQTLSGCVFPYHPESLNFRSGFPVSIRKLSEPLLSQCCPPGRPLHHVFISGCRHRISTHFSFKFLLGCFPLFLLCPSVHAYCLVLLLEPFTVNYSGPKALFGGFHILYQTSVCSNTSSFCLF